MGQDSVSGIVGRLAETCPLPALHGVDVQSGVKRLSSQPSVPVKALPVLLWAPRLKTGVVKSTLNDGSHQSHRTALPCLKRGPPPSVLSPHTPLLKITNLDLPSRYHKVFCCKSQKHDWTSVRTSG